MDLFYKVIGTGGKHLVILHGLLGSSDNWQSVARHLAANYTVHLLDMRNHGRSPHSSDMNYLLMAEDVIDYIVKWKIHQPIIIGHSMGGKIAMTMALLYPQYVSQIVVIDIAPKAYSGGHEYIINAMMEIPLDKFSSRNEVEAWLSERIKGQGIRQFIMKNLGRNPDHSFRWDCNLNAISYHYPELMNFNFNGITHIKADFIRGQLSDYIMPEDEVLIQSFFPNNMMHTVHNAGHWVHADNPDGFAYTLKQILH